MTKDHMRSPVTVLGLLAPTAGQLQVTILYHTQRLYAYERYDMTRSTTSKAASLGPNHLPWP